MAKAGSSLSLYDRYHLVREEAWEAIRKENESQGEALLDVVEGMIHESDRGCVLVAASVIDQELRALLTTFFKKQSGASDKEISFFFEGGGIPPLQSTALKIRMASVLGLVDRETSHALREIQNLRSTVAAHTRKRMKLTDQQVDSIVCQLIPDARKTLAEGLNRISPDTIRITAGSRAKLLFAMTVSSLVGVIASKIEKLTRTDR
jgi:hypothetical protein